MNVTKRIKGQINLSKKVRTDVCFYTTREITRLTRDERSPILLAACGEVRKVERGRFYQQFGERSEEAGSNAHAFTAFVEQLAPSEERTQQQETGIQRVHPFDPYNLMRKFTSSYERKQWNELGFQPTAEQYTMVRNVKFAYGIIAEPFCGETTAGGEPSRIHQDTIVHEIGIDQQVNGNNRVVLSNEERDILVKIAQAVGIPCDPERTVYFYDELPRATWLDKRRVPQSTVVDAGK